MSAAILTFALVSTQYRSTLVFKLPDTMFRGYIGCTVLTDQATFAGFTCESLGHHGETSLSKPFVWSKGNFARLPLLPTAEYGQVLDGNDQILVGGVTVDDRILPVKWTPDPKLGWAKAKVSQISEKPGQATHITSDGTTWIQNDNRVIAKVQNGKWQPVTFGEFTLVGVDGRGRMYGNRFSGITFGSRPANTQPGWFSGPDWTALSVEEASKDFQSDSELKAVNADGTAVGKCENQFAVWQDGKVSLPLPGKYQWSFASGINESGTVIGTAGTKVNNSVVVFLWKDGSLIDLSNVLPKVELDYGNKINRHGDIAVVGRINRQTLLYLLQPLEG